MENSVIEINVAGFQNENVATKSFRPQRNVITFFEQEGFLPELQAERHPGRTVLREDYFGDYYYR